MWSYITFFELKFKLYGIIIKYESINFLAWKIIFDLLKYSTLTVEFFEIILTFYYEFKNHY